MTSPLTLQFLGEINVDFAAPRKIDGESGGFQKRSNDRAKAFGDEPSQPSDTLFVGNISFDATEDVLGEEFGKHGSVISVRLPTDRDSGAPKGYGYVQFDSIDSAQAAFTQLNGADISGRSIRLDYARPRDNSGGAPRGNRNFGGDRGGRGRGFGGGDRGRGGRGGGRGRGGFGDRGGRGGSRGGRGGSTNRGGFGDFQGKKMTF